MLISREKRKTNIAEYILYMWQVEDTIRAFSFDTGRIRREIIGRYAQPESVRNEMKEWYENLAEHMRNDKVEKSGHVVFLRNIVKELYDFHLSLISGPHDPEYSSFYAVMIPLIREMNARQKWTSDNEIETCLNAVYIFMMMRLRGDKITAETEEAMNGFVKLLAMLGERFRAMEEAEM